MAAAPREVIGAAGEEFSLRRDHDAHDRGVRAPHNGRADLLIERIDGRAGA
ncbi:MAG TPA: hypothetical protein VGQ26_22115 [Streptosporangiaceae bacterium]|jgi:hypothetical protein|nr:hypothetical protein [Streptosporangiaceae bacterium]